MNRADGKEKGVEGRKERGSVWLEEEVSDEEEIEKEEKETMERLGDKVER